MHQSFSDFSGCGFTTGGSALLAEAVAAINGVGIGSRGAPPVSGKGSFIFCLAAPRHVTVDAGCAGDGCGSPSGSLGLLQASHKTQPKNEQIGSAALPLGGCDQHPNLDASSPHHVNRGVSLAPRAGSR